MYEANGVTKEFPLPYGADGSVVVLMSPSGGATRMQEGAAYAVRNGAAFFTTAPPAGWTVAFEMPEGAVGASAAKTVCTVVYPDGTIREVERDPWELLAAAQAANDKAEQLLRSALTDRHLTVKELQGMAEEAKSALSARLLTYNDRAESAIAAAARATADDAAAAVNKHLLEIRNKHREVMGARQELATLARRAEEAAAASATEAATLLREQISCTCKETHEAYEHVRAIETRVRELCNEAKNAAVVAGAELNKAFGSRADLVVEEIRGVREALSREIAGVIEPFKIETQRLIDEIRHIRDDARLSANRIAAVERRCEGIDKATAAREGGMTNLWEKIQAFGRTFDSKIEQLRAMNRKGIE